jgi:hypothetical protein
VHEHVGASHVGRGLVGRGRKVIVSDCWARDGVSEKPCVRPRGRTTGAARPLCTRLSLDGCDCGALGSALKTAARSLHVALDASASTRPAACRIARSLARGTPPRWGLERPTAIASLHADSFRYTSYVDLTIVVIL